MASRAAPGTTTVTARGSSAASVTGAQGAPLITSGIGSISGPTRDTSATATAVTISPRSARDTPRAIASGTNAPDGTSRAAAIGIRVIPVATATLVSPA